MPARALWRLGDGERVGAVRLEGEPLHLLKGAPEQATVADKEGRPEIELAFICGQIELQGHELVEAVGVRLDAIVLGIAHERDLVDAFDLGDALLR